MRLRGMREIPSSTEILHRSTSTSRSALAGQLARMELAEITLEKQLQMWIGKERETEKELRKVRDRVEEMQRMISQTCDVGPKGTTDTTRRSSGGDTSEERDGSGAREWKTMPLEY